MSEQPKSYNPIEIEKKWRDLWEKANISKPSGNGDSYCIVIPPPNVTGSLHMGHGFQYTLMDILIRYHRMQNFNTLWQVGTDHAGIATQMVVERELAKENKSRHDLGRDGFLEKIWQWKQHSGNRIGQQIRRLAASVDWSSERFTMDDGLTKAVQKVFIQLYDEGLIYRGKRLVNWDPKFKTAISDLEVISEEEEGSLWHIQYPLEAQSNQSITIATTRPETLLGDVAIAVHPDDERYQSFIGKMVTVPICGRLIPIIADTDVDPSFGTGCVKITPAHDFLDYQIGQKHQLPQINILNPDATLNDQVPKGYQGLDRFDARKKIVDELKTHGALVKVEPHTSKIPRGDRSGVVIEPYLTDQWFVHAKPLAEPAIEAVKSGEIKFVPENWANTYYQWMENIEDWCISRQLWWGHRIPAWYDDEGHYYVGESIEAVRAKYKLDQHIQLQQDEDVLDTWFSSALWPFSSLGWPESDNYKTFYPTNVLVTGFDIIFFWVARMIMFGLKFTGNIPFEKVYITGLIRDTHGQKMSKSKGNVIDPLDLIDGISLEELVKKRTTGLMQPHIKDKIATQTKNDFPNGIDSHGCDAVRFTFTALASNSRDISFDLQRLNGYKNFCNKIWNAHKYILMQTDGFEYGDHQPIGHFINQWIHIRLHQCIADCHRHIQQYRFDLMAQSLFDFIWRDYCDWYVEMSKILLRLGDEHLRYETQRSLLTVFEQAMRLMHPIMPFITEACWENIAKKIKIEADSIATQPYPKAEAGDESLIDTIDRLKQIITAIRNIKGEMNIPPKKVIQLCCKNGTKSDKSLIKHAEKFIQGMLNIESIQWTEETPANAAQQAIGELELFIPLEGLVDANAEIERVEKLLKKLNKDFEKLDYKLNKTKFVEQAPKETVKKEQIKFDALIKQKSLLEEQRDQLQQLKQQTL